MRGRRVQDDESEDFGPSKTQLKQALEAVHELGGALLELPDAQLDDIEMEDNLRDALRESRQIRGFEARRRQMQYVHKLLRQADLEPLRRAVTAHRLGRSREAEAFQLIETWRERLLADDTGLEAWVQEFPASDSRQFRAQLRDARRELASGTRGRAYRELFRAVRSVLEATPEIPP